MSFRSLITATLLPLLLVPAVGCDKAPGDEPLTEEELEQQAFNEELNRIIDQELDLQGEACDPQMVREHVSDNAYRICNGGQGIQQCAYDEWNGQGTIWNRCLEAAACTPGDSVDTTPDDPICPGTTYCVQVEDVTAWSDVPPCNTPLVLRFEDAPVSFHAFDANEPVSAFAPAGTCTTTDWPTATTPWLVYDRDGNGKIEGGEELFGSGTVLESGRKATQGFEALAELDDNRDGRIDEQDESYTKLALWADHDADRESQADELSTLRDAGVHMLSVDYHEKISCDERGNCGRERAAFEFATDYQSRVGEIVDVYLPCRG